MALHSITPAGFALIDGPRPGPSRVRAPASPRPVFGGPAEEPRGRVRVGIVYAVLLVGGSEDWLATLVRAVDSDPISWQGLAVMGACDRGMVAEFEDRMPVSSGASAARELARRCDVIVTWGVPGLENLLAGISPRPRVVCVSHSPSQSMPWASSFFGPGVDQAVAVHDLALDPIPKPLRAGASVIWNAVDHVRMTPTRSREGMRASWGVPPGSKVLGYIGRFEREQKDSRAMARVLPHMPAGWCCVAVGRGRDRPALASAGPGLYLPGPDRDAGSVVSAFDAMLVPSDFESFGLSLCEGLWAGVPVIATRVGVAQPIEGLVREIPFRASGESIAAALAEDVRDVSGTAARVAHARTWARRELSMERFGREWTDLLVRAASAPRVSPRAGKPRVSIDGLARARRECVPCRAAAAAQTASSAGDVESAPVTESIRALGKAVGFGAADPVDTVGTP